MKLIEFTVPGNPIALKRHRNFRTKTGINIQYDPSKKDKSDFIAKCIQHQPQKPYEIPLSISLNIYLQRPKNHYRTGKNSELLKDSAPLWVTKKPDIDNFIKFIFDSFNGVFFRDDSQICSLTAIKKYCDCPRVEVTLFEISPEKQS
mgnify:CR=1 FL=1|jgi:Holliday junction resolvase RusA-like endonuclease|tara:strand:- start:1205 stop:1645 length:441 start_codon:yes stop_codon:yes gene_type:complete